MKRQVRNWQKIFRNHICDKGLESGIHKELSKLSRKKNKQFKLENGQKT